MNIASPLCACREAFTRYQAIPVSKEEAAQGHHLVVALPVVDDDGKKLA
jgi:hypothetical protein